MYDKFYGFAIEPFRLSPDHHFAFEHKAYAKARAYMAYAFLRAEGFVMITGRPGTGKTTLVGSLIEQLAGENVSTANLVCTQLEADDLLKMVAYEFGVSQSITYKGELLQELGSRLKSWHRDGRRALLIVDEAQDLSVSAMEELRLLTNIQIGGKPLLQIFLLGQPELRELVLSPQLEQVHQRLVAASHLRPLELGETEAYIRHRLERAGWRGDPAISKPIYPLIHKFSEGIPRRINLICSRLFLHCAVEQRHQVKVIDMREVVRELQDENLAAGGRFTDHDFRVRDEFEVTLQDPDPGSAQFRPVTAHDEAPADAVGAEFATGHEQESDAAKPRSSARVVPLQARTQPVASVPRPQRLWNAPAGTQAPGVSPGEPGFPVSGGAVQQQDEQSGDAVAHASPVSGSAPSAREPGVAVLGGEAVRMGSGPSTDSGASGALSDEVTAAERERAVQARLARRNAAQRPPDRSGWVVFFLVVLSVGLVAWAATGFSLGPLTR